MKPITKEFVDNIRHGPTFEEDIYVLMTMARATLEWREHLHAGALRPGPYQADMRRECDLVDSILSGLGPKQTGGKC